MLVLLYIVAAPTDTSPSRRATGCTMTLIEDPNFHYADMRNNGPLSEAYASIMKETFGQKIVTDKSASMTASTDFGNVCYKLPAISPNFRECYKNGSTTRRVSL